MFMFYIGIIHIYIVLFYIGLCFMLYLLISLDTYIIGIPRSTALINLF